MLIARRNPGEQQTTSEVHLDVGPTTEIPSQPERNANVDALKQLLNDAAGLPGLDLAPGSSELSFRQRPSFRDMVAFNFQPQHLVANPYTLFFKADTYEHKEKLKAVMPLPLGTRTASDLEHQRQLDDLERELAQAKRQLDDRRAAFDRWASEVQSFHAQAVELGLLNSPSEDQSLWEVDRFISELRMVPRMARGAEIPAVQEGSTEVAVNALVQVINEEERVAERIGILRSRLEAIALLRQSADDYGAELTRQADRLEAQGWFRQRVSDTTVCPLCLSPQTTSAHILKELDSYAQQLEAMTSSVRRTPGVLDRERTELSSEIRSLEARLAACRTKRREWEDQSEQEAARRQKLSQVYRLAGRIEQAVANIDAMDRGAELDSRISDLDTSIAGLRERLNERTYRHRQHTALEKISRLIGDYASMLELERANDIAQLDIQNLTLRFTSDTGRLDYLWELGGGENWMGYHLAAMLALHEYFLTLPHCPVPSFLVLDQPSQVYFPEEFPSPEDENEASVSRDIAGVKRVFRALSSASSRTDGSLQIIITEHAGESYWRGTPDIHMAQNWHGDTHWLIPRDWIDDES